MKLFIWRGTRCNQLYSHGNIVAMAPDLDAAKAAVLEAAKAATIGYCDMKGLADQLTWSKEFRADAQAEIDGVLAKVRADLEAAPTVYETDAAAFFNGGE